MTALIENIISSDYTVGDYVEHEPILHGDVNKSYAVTVRMNGQKRIYYLKQYHLEKKENEIIFEHEIIRHLEKKQFNLIAGPILTKNKKTYTKQLNGQGYYFALFHFLSGEDRYDWFLPRCSRKDLRDAAAVLANFHNEVTDFEATGKCYDFKILDFLSVATLSILKYSKKRVETPFDVYFNKNINSLLTFVKKTIRTLKEDIKKEDRKRLSRIIIHCDYHPGNLKFTSDSVTGLFDFDWAKRGLRCFDVALAITYFCAEEGEISKLRLCMDKTKIFLRSYQNTCGHMAEPLNEKELELIPAMIKVSAVYILNWIIQSYWTRKDRIGHVLYLNYLKYYTEFLTWIEIDDNLRELEKF